MATSLQSMPIIELGKFQELIKNFKLLEQITLVMIKMSDAKNTQMEQILKDANSIIGDTAPAASENIRDVFFYVLFPLFSDLLSIFMPLSDSSTETIVINPNQIAAINNELTRTMLIYLVLLNSYKNHLCSQYIKLSDMYIAELAQFNITNLSNVFCHIDKHVELTLKYNLTGDINMKDFMTLRRVYVAMFDHLARALDSTEFIGAVNLLTEYTNKLNTALLRRQGAQRHSKCLIKAVEPRPTNMSNIYIHSGYDIFSSSQINNTSNQSLMGLLLTNSTKHGCKIANREDVFGFGHPPSAVAQPGDGEYYDDIKHEPGIPFDPNYCAIKVEYNENDQFDVNGNRFKPPPSIDPTTISGTCNKADELNINTTLEKLLVDIKNKIEQMNLIYNRSELDPAALSSFNNDIEIAYRSLNEVVDNLLTSSYKIITEFIPAIDNNNAIKDFISRQSEDVKNSIAASLSLDAAQECATVHLLNGMNVQNLIVEKCKNVIETINKILIFYEQKEKYLSSVRVITTSLARIQLQLVKGSSFPIVTNFPLGANNELMLFSEMPNRFTDARTRILTDADTLNIHCSLDGYALMPLEYYILKHDVGYFKNTQMLDKISTMYNTTTNDFLDLIRMFLYELQITLLTPPAPAATPVNTVVIKKIRTPTTSSYVRFANAEYDFTFDKADVTALPIKYIYCISNISPGAGGMSNKNSIFLLQSFLTFLEPLFITYALTETTTDHVNLLKILSMFITQCTSYTHVPGTGGSPDGATLDENICPLYELLCIRFFIFYMICTMKFDSVTTVGEDILQCKTNCPNFVPLFNKFIAKEGVKNRLSNNQITYTPATKTLFIDIKKINAAVSRNFTQQIQVDPQFFTELENYTTVFPDLSRFITKVNSTTANTPPPKYTIRKGTDFAYLDRLAIISNLNQADFGCVGLCSVEFDNQNFCVQGLRAEISATNTFAGVKIVIQ